MRANEICEECKDDRESTAPSWKFLQNSRAACFCAYATFPGGVRGIHEVMQLTLLPCDARDPL